MDINRNENLGGFAHGSIALEFKSRDPISPVTPILAPDSHFQSCQEDYRQRPRGDLKETETVLIR